MSEISVIGNAVVGNIRTTAPPTAAAPASSIEATAPSVESGIAVTTDSVDFSPQAQLLEKIHELPSVRQEKVDGIKEAIASETYLTDDKLHIAFDRLINEII